MKKTKRKWSRISKLHFAKLFLRSGLFLATLAAYIVNRLTENRPFVEEIGKLPVILFVVWGLFALEMVLRFFPSKFESMGCQKQFAKNYEPIEGSDLKNDIHSPKKTLIVALFWFLLNAPIALLYFLGVIDSGILVLIGLLYGVFDMICILFFCPFETWFLKNKCCVGCRIYNWDYAMMFTPFLLIPSLFTWSLCALAIGILLKWEIIHYKYPERFSEKTNACLSCDRCEEKLCHHKRQLENLIREYWKKAAAWEKELKKNFPKTKKDE